MSLPQSTHRPASRLLWAAALFTLLVLPLSAWGERLVLGSDGTVYRLLDGTYGELFATGGAADADNLVLALDVLRTDGVTERWLVPGTESRDPESAASLVFEDQTERVYILYETQFNDLHPLLRLNSFDGTEWSQAIEIANGPFTRKGSPKMVITRETAGLSSATAGRTILHLTWWEEDTEVSQKRYSPIILSEGRYLGWSPVIDLAEYSLESVADDPPTVPGLEWALSVQAGSDDRKVVVGFVHPDTHRLITLQMEALAPALSQLADKARAQIIILGNKAASYTELAESAASEILELGTEFHKAIRLYMAEEIRRLIASTDGELTPDEVLAIADKARAQIIILGSKIGAGGLEDASGVQILELGQTVSGGGPYHHLKVSVASDRVAPEVGGPADLLLSESGRNVIVVWDEGEAIHYRESRDDGWSDTHVIELSERLDREAVYRMLEQRVRND